MCPAIPSGPPSPPSPPTPASDGPGGAGGFLLKKLSEKSAPLVAPPAGAPSSPSVSYTHLRAHET